ncbi:MAG: tyrosine-type recombinase/integrase [Gammaproteobacteria bacterium]
MGRKKTPGLQKRGNIWYIDKKIFGKRICETTCTDSLEEAEKYLAHRIQSLHQAKIYGVRPKRIFREAAIKYLSENQHKASIHQDALWLKVLDAFIGDLPLEAVHMENLQKKIAQRQKDGVKHRTINYGLQVTRRILNLAASEWLDEHGLTWLTHAPKIKLLSESDKRKPYPLSWSEQERLLEELPTHLQNMTLFAINTGCRDQEICRLQWSWEVKVSENCSGFIIPGQFVKNRDDRLVVLNDVPKSVIEGMRGTHPEFVFTYRGKGINRMLTSAWKRARKRCSLPHLGVHDLKHTFGRRLRAAGVRFEDRQDLLGHQSDRITTHYSVAEIHQLTRAANSACERHNDVSMTMWQVNEFVQRA